MSSAPETLDVWLPGVRVGQLTRFEDEVHVFEQAQEYLEHQNRPILGQLFEDLVPAGLTTTGCPQWFANLLPQGRLRRLICRSAEIEEYDNLRLLEILGHDLPGAVRITRSVPGLVGSRQAEPPAANGSEGRQSGLSFSLAGAQVKLSLKLGERGLTAPVQGEAGDWIAKLYDPEYPGLPRVELATMSWARASGLHVPVFRAGSADEIQGIPAGVPIGDGRLYLIERFDRTPGGGRRHMEDFAQILDRPPGNRQYVGSYEHIAAILRYVAPHSLAPFLRQLSFCLVCGNTDAHLKNFALVYDGSNASLSPAYDLVATILYSPPIEDGLALTLDGARAFEGVTLHSFEALARAADLAASEVSRMVASFIDESVTAWSEHSADLPFTAEERRRLEAHMRRLPLLR